MGLDRYRVEGGKITFHTFKEGQNFNSSAWLENRGQFERKESGEYYEYYTEIEGKYIRDSVKEEEVAALELEEETKIAKEEALASLVVTTNTVPFDANDQSVNYMSAVLALANFKLAQAIENGVDTSEAYAAIYKSTISWRNANNTNSEVQLETVAEALEEAMTKIGEIKTDAESVV